MMLRSSSESEDEAQRVQQPAVTDGLSAPTSDLFQVSGYDQVHTAAPDPTPGAGPEDTGFSVSVGADNPTIIQVRNHVPDYDQFLSELLLELNPNDHQSFAFFMAHNPGHFNRVVEELRELSSRRAANRVNADEQMIDPSLLTSDINPGVPGAVVSRPRTQPNALFANNDDPADDELSVRGSAGQAPSMNRYGLQQQTDAEMPDDLMIEDPAQRSSWVPDPNQPGASMICAMAQQPRPVARHTAACQGATQAFADQTAPAPASPTPSINTGASTSTPGTNTGVSTRAAMPPPPVPRRVNNRVAALAARGGRPAAASDSSRSRAKRRSEFTGSLVAAPPRGCSECRGTEQRPRYRVCMVPTPEADAKYNTCTECITRGKTCSYSRKSFAEIMGKDPSPSPSPSPPPSPPSGPPRPPPRSPPSPPPGASGVAV